MAIKLTPYTQWEPASPLTEPRSLPPAQLATALTEIVAGEGPMLQALLFARYVQGVPDLSRAGRVVREALENGLTLATGRDDLEVAHELGRADAQHSVVLVPDGAQVVPRSRGERSLDEISLSELAAIFTLVRNSVGATQYTESVQRALLNELGLVRLTAPAKQRLLLAWRIADAWRDAGVRDVNEATIITEPIAGGVEAVVGTDMRGKKAATKRRPNVGTTSLWDSYSLNPKPKTTRVDDSDA